MKKGFTLIELLSAIVILAIILVLSLPKNPNYLDGSSIKTDLFEKKAAPTDESCFTFDTSTNTITGYDFEDPMCPKHVVIPSQIGGIDVTKIGEFSFTKNALLCYDSYYNMHVFDVDYEPDEAVYHFCHSSVANDLKSIVIPDTVTTIGMGAFANGQIENISLGNSVTTIAQGAFVQNQLTNLIIPNSVTAIGDFVFSENQLTSATIPNGVTTLGYASFAYNLITNVTIPNSVITIGIGAFADNPLTRVKIPNSVEEIGRHAFWWYDGGYPN